MRDIGLATFLDLKRNSDIPVYCQNGVSEPTVDDLECLKSVGAAVHSEFKANNIEVPRLTVLNTLASAVGSRNWNQYRATAIPVTQVQELIKRAQRVQSYADDEGCSDGYTVTYGPAIDSLINACEKVQKTIDAAKA